MTDLDHNGVPIHTLDLVRYVKNEALDLFDMDDPDFHFTALLLQAAAVRLQVLHNAPNP
jgi:hypothetical protein